MPSYQLPTGVRLAVPENELVSVLLVRKPARRVHPGLERLRLGGLVCLWQAPEARKLLKREDLEGAGEKRGMRGTHNTLKVTRVFSIPA